MPYVFEDLKKLVLMIQNKNQLVQVLSNWKQLVCVNQNDIKIGVTVLEQLNKESSSQSIRFETKHLLIIFPTEAKLQIV